LDALVQLRGIELPSGPELGRTFYHVGLIEGGVAPNVIAPHASAEVMFRTVGDAADVLRAMEPLRALVRLEEVLRVPPVRMHTVPGFETAVFAFTTDIPFLPRWGRPLLCGPGSILLAHTDHEHLPLDELDAAVERYERLAVHCLRA
jgi:acetylornithine deacetylase